TALRLLSERLQVTIQGAYMNSGASAPERMVWLSRLKMLSFPELSSFDRIKDLQDLHAKMPGWYQHEIRMVPEFDQLPASAITVRGLRADPPDPTTRRDLASAAIRLADKHDVTPLVRALMAHKEDAKDPVIPQLVWLAYERVISKKDGASTPVEKELTWLAE